jgi:hypothetical protein
VESFEHIKERGDMNPRELFLSHSSRDRGIADRIAEVLKRHGVPVWYSRVNIRGAQQWHDEIGAALRRCDWFAVLLSPNSVESIWVKREFLFALQQSRFEGKIIPILLSPCDADQLSWTLSLSRRST